MSLYEGNKPATKRVVVLFEANELHDIDKMGVAMGARSRSEAIRSLVRDGKSQHPTTEKEKGPAGSAIPPSLGSNNPLEGKADERVEV